MAVRTDPGELERQLFTELAAGPLPAPELQRRLGISQSTFSRLVARVGERLLAAGDARARRYAARRAIEPVSDRIPVYAIDENARARRALTLHSILPEGFYADAASGDYSSGFYADLPYFLNDARPSGFLGRLVPAQHPELGLPTDVRNWSGTQTLRYLALFGWNLPGNLIVGDEAFRRYMEHAQNPPDRVASGGRKRRYLELAEGVLATVPGSSAGGEQPKFLVSLADRGALLVKFSPPMTTFPGRRQADLLISEHVAHRTLSAHGRGAARSALVVADQRTFLEVERFDRTAPGGRVAVSSLASLDAEFVGRGRSWSDSVAALVEHAIVPRTLLEEVRWLELFGRLIGNTDMHTGNLSFFTAGERVTALAPIYDMLPARYAGHAGEPFDGTLSFAPPVPGDASVWETASAAAIAFWRAVAAERSVTPQFARIAERNATEVVAWRRLGELLPQPSLGPAARRHPRRVPGARSR